MESDERFKHLASDPRFKTLRKKQRKVQIDDRFQSMFTDEKFTLKYTKDKRGRKQNKTSGDDLKKYYSLKEDPRPKLKLTDDVDDGDKEDEDEGHEEDEEEEVEEVEEVEEEEEEEEEEEDNSDSSISQQDEREEDQPVETSESELSSSSDESESEEDLEESDDEDELEAIRVKYDWRPLDHDAEKADNVTRRLAFMNLEWDKLDVRDLYTLVNSIRTPLSVKIYVSEFGKERLAKEELEGPEEFIDKSTEDDVEEEYNQLRDKMRALKNPDSKTYKINEYEDADEEMDPKNEEVRERIRRYQLNKMKYFYAIAEFDSVESAELVYKELDGMEYEGSSLELDLRFVPDDMVFDLNDIRAECNKLPDLASYKAPQFISTALQQTTVKFTWDETDVKRQEKLRRAYTKEELEKDDLDAYLASETDSDSDSQIEADADGDARSTVTANSEARAQKYRILLQTLEKEEEKKKKNDVDIEWGDYSDDGHKVDDMINGDDDDDDNQGENEMQFSSDAEEDSDSESVVKESVRTESKKRKSSKSNKKSKKGKLNEANQDDDELDLLVLDANSRTDEFKFDPDDDRFKAVYESGLYNIDPSHPNFKRTQAFDLMAERKRQRRQKKTNNDKR